MDNSTEYCSFVSIDYIICECGDTFPNEDALKDHFDKDHIVPKQEKVEEQPTSLLESFSIKKEPLEPLVITEKLPEADMQPNLVFLFDLQGDDQLLNEYYVQNSNVNDIKLVIEPEWLKQENVVLEYVEQPGEIVEAKVEPESKPLAGRQVTFKKELIADQVVILDERSDEHDYDRETDKRAPEVFYFCEVCGKSFSALKSVNMHMQKMHQISTPRNKKAKNAICDVCGKKYAMWQRVCECGTPRPVQNPNQKRYQSGRSGRPREKKQYTCDICGVGRSSNAALRYHQRVHTGERPYKCTMCPKTFTMPLFLQIHVRSHTGVRPYQCHICPKAFTNKAALLRHDRVHTGIKPYACPQCGKTFTQSNSMKLHFQTVHLKMPAPYKSAARKLKAMQKLMSMDETVRKGKKTKAPVRQEPEETEQVEEYEEQETQLELIQDGQYEYMVEDSQYSEEGDYEDDIISDHK